MSEKRRDNRNRILHTGESQRKDGRYAFKFIDANKKPHFVYSWKLVPTDRVPKGKRNCLSLREKEKEVWWDLEDGIDYTGKKMSVCQLYVRYIRCRPNIRPGTVSGRNQLIRLLCEDPIGFQRIDSIKPTDAIGWAMRMSEKGYAYTTISNHKRSLKAAFFSAVRDDILRKNPFDFKLSEIIRDETVPKKPLSSAQEESLLSFVRTDAVYCRYYDELIILLGTGLRISELCGLTEADIDFEGRSIRIDHQLLRAKGGGHYIAEPKTKCGERVIYMGDRVFNALQRVVARRGAGPSLVIDGKSGFLFLNRKNLPMSAQSYASVFRGLARKYRKGNHISLPDVFTPHTLRHTFCTNMANRGMNPKTLQYVMGHSDIKMTLGYYTHTTTETALEEMRRIAA